MNLATVSSRSALAKIQTALEQRPDGVLDDVARRHGVALRAVLDLLPAATARAAPGVRFCEIWRTSSVEGR